MEESHGTDVIFKADQDEQETPSFFLSSTQHERFSFNLKSLRLHLGDSRAHI